MRCGCQSPTAGSEAIVAASSGSSLKDGPGAKGRYLYARRMAESGDSGLSSKHTGPTTCSG